MTKQAIAPTQAAYDRIQRAGTRSPMMIGDIGIVYELRKDGVNVRGVRQIGNITKEYNHLVGWSELGLSNVDPLMLAHETVMAQLTKLQEVSNASG